MGRSLWVAGSTKTRYNMAAKSNREYPSSSRLLLWGGGLWCGYTGRNRDLQSKSRMSYMTDLRTKSPMTLEN